MSEQGSGRRRSGAGSVSGSRPTADDDGDPGAAAGNSNSEAATTARRSGSPRTPAVSAQSVQSGGVSGYARRLTLPLTVEDDKALKLAKVEDSIEAAVRLRAMVALWRESERYRASVDRRARKMRTR